MDPRRRLRALIAGAFAVLCALAAAPAAPAQATAPFSRTGARVAATECERCHEREARRLRTGPHAAVLAAAALPGCETCHGPGGAHAADAANDPALVTLPSALDPAQQSALCGRCHADQIVHHGGDPAGFRAAGLSCTDCHTVHRRPLEPVLPGVRFARRDEQNAHAEPTGAAECTKCHPLRDARLAASPHASLAAAAAPDGCERCHGAGSLHAASGASRLVTRPDRAADGVATCRTCHAGVDAVAFHWRDRPAPRLSPDATCTTCHTVHAPRDPGTAAAAAAAAEPPATEPPATNRLCARCHAPAFGAVPEAPHAALARLDEPLDRGCGACHRGGAAHARSGGRREALVPWRADAAAEAAVCLACHSGGRTLAHAPTGAHLRAGVRCSDCHGPLHEAHRGGTAAEAERRCAACHPATAAEFAAPAHHPVPEGRVHCGDCHDVHGEGPAGRARERTEARCVECHPQYRGPFVFAHQASRRGGCVVCHMPHGGPNRRLLRQPTSQQNCLQCHGDFPAFHDQTRGAVFTDCLRCHTEVHGSDHARYLFR